MADRTGKWPVLAVTTDAQREENLTKVKEMKDDIAERAQLIINDIMPAKILQLNELFRMTCADDIIAGRMPGVARSSVFTQGDLDGIHYDTRIPVDASSSSPDSEEPATKKRKIDNSDAEANGPQTLVPCNKTIVQLLKVLKMEILQLIEYCNTVKIWIQLNIPRIEDGNNFGVSIQEETVNELSRAEDSGFTVLESITKYFVMRGKLVSKIHKYPYLMDYRSSVEELDEKEYINLRLCTQDLRNNYAILHDMITKNMEKIKKPRTNNGSSMVY